MRRLGHPGSIQTNIKILPPICLFVGGVVLGFVSKMLDLYTSYIGRVFSEVSIWILLGTMIAIFSRTRLQACVNIFPFCVGMLLSYYVTSEIIKSGYAVKAVYLWAVVALLSPGLAYLAWMTKEKGVFPKIVAGGIILVTILASVLFFGGLKIHDVVILLVMVYLLFFMKIRREERLALQE